MGKVRDKLHAARNELRDGVDSVQRLVTLVGLSIMLTALTLLLMLARAGEGGGRGAV